MPIGQLLELLRQEFPEISVSKLRFLENEGLITPQRTGSGYRKYSPADVVRFRYILAAQRDKFWPLRVIGAHLDQLDRGEEGTEPQLELAALGPSQVKPREPRMTPADLAGAAGARESDIDELVRLGLLRPDRSGRFEAADAAIVRLIASLAPFGIELRHLRPLINAVNHESELIAQSIEPLSRAGRSGAKQTAMDRGDELAGILIALHSALLRQHVRERG